MCASIGSCVNGFLKRDVYGLQLQGLRNIACLAIQPKTECAHIFNKCSLCLVAVLGQYRLTSLRHGCVAWRNVGMNPCSLPT